MTTIWDLGETLESPFAPIDSVPLPFAHEEPAPATQGRIRADKEVGWELEPSFEQLAPGSQITAAVGQGQTNSPDDVRRVQGRLRNLGMSWVPDSGTIGAAQNDPTDHGIRLFRAMLEAEQLWAKKARSSPCYGTPVGKNRGTIQPGSTEETWLWSMGAPRWLSTVPAQRDGWCCNDKSAETGCRADIAEPAMSSWLAEYLDQVGRAFRGKVQAFRPVLTVLASQGLSSLERLRSPSLPRTGPLSPADEEARRIAAIAQRVAIDLVNPASASRLDATRIAGETVAAIDGGRIVLTVSYIAVPQGGCSTNHLGHQQGLEFDLRLFAHDGPKPGVSWKDMRCSRLLMGLAVDCFVENPLTRVVIYNDPAIRERVGGRLSSDKAQGTTHDNHVHVGIVGSAGHRLIRAPLPADPSGMGPTLEQLLAPSEEDFAGESPEGCCSTCAPQRQEAAGAFEQFGSQGARTYAIADYVSLVRKAEAAYPRWTPDEILSALRRVAGYDTTLFRILYGTSEANPIKAGDGGLTADDLRDLEAMSSHRGGVVEKGVAIDPLGQKVAVGHVLCGLSAGEHRNLAVGMLGGWLLGAALQHVAGLTLDNLYATTIAGDLGQSAVLVHLGRRSSLLGLQSEATDAELIGDIDGCVLASNGALGGRRVSDVLARYYWAAPAAQDDVHAANRFRLFASHLTGSVLQDQTTRFARAFFIKEDLRRGSTESAAGEVAQVLSQFRAWCGQKLAAETARPASVQPEQGEGMGTTTTWSLDETFESPFAPADPVRLPLAYEGLRQAADEVGSAELWVPGAKRITNPRSGGGSYLDAPWRFVFHTIEGEPTAAGFQRLAAEHTNTPHLWAMPSADLLLQTVPLNRSAYALARPGSVQTNRLCAIQVEMWGFAAKMGQMDQRTIEWLADRLLGPVAKLVPINLDHVRPTGGVSCYGRNSGCRMTPEQWQVFDGVCGHQHVPDNEHWDPGDAPLRAIAARARGSAGSHVPQREQLGDHDGPGFAAERDEDEFESWTGGFEQLTPPDAATPPPPGFAPRPPEPPLAKAIPIIRDCCLLDVKSLKDTTTMGRYTTPGGPASGVPGTVYTARAGFVDLGHLLTFADVTAFVYQQIYAKKGAAGTIVTTAYGTAELTAAVADNLWLEQARKIAYDDSIAYEIETTKGASSFIPGHLNSAFSPEDLCSNYLGTVVTAKALYSPTTKAGYTLSWANRVDGVLVELLQFLGVRSVVEASEAFVLKNNVWIAWTNEASGLSPYYLKRRNFTNTPWLAGHPSDQPGWAPTPFASTPAYTYTHRSGFTKDHFEREINTFRAWAQATFGPDYDKP